MKQLLEEAVPYDQSVLWQIHDTYFATRGTDAWVAGDIPYMSTSNYAAARPHARLLEALVAELEARGTLAPDAPIAVLEIGSGLGEFAINFLRALDERLVPRIRYILSDYQAQTVRGALEAPELQRHLEAGRIIGARFDMRTPGELVDLDGAPLQIPLTAVLANYVCCVAPIKVLCKNDDHWSEAVCTVSALEPLEDVLMRATRPGVLRSLDITWGWRPAALDALLDPFHVDVVTRIARAYPQAIVRYPHVFFDLLRALRERLVPGGMMLISDYGSADGAVLKGIDFRPDMFGNSLANSVDFAVFEHFCAAAGASMGRTRGELRSLHTAVIRFGAMSTRFAEAFARLEQAGCDSDLLLDLCAAARHYATGEQRNPFRAVRLFQRCLDLDPYSAALHHEIADSCIEAGLFELAEVYLRRCAELDQRDEHDVDFELGRVFARTARPREALASYLRSLEREENPATLANIGFAHMELGDLAAGERALVRSLELAPEYERAAKLLEELRAKAAP